MLSLSPFPVRPPCKGEFTQLRPHQCTHKDGNHSRVCLLATLPAIFQSDRNLVYEFVSCGGLEELVTLGDDDQLQNLILRALGQIMLYVDGMNGVMQNAGAVRFLYKLIAANNALVCKTAIKLLLVFVEYTESVRIRIRI